jgi:hypothetical protein
MRFTETADKVRRERLLPGSLPPLVGKRVHLQPGTQRDSATIASLRRLVAALGAKASSTMARAGAALLNSCGESLCCWLSSLALPALELRQLH